MEPYEMPIICNRTDVKGYYLEWSPSIIEIVTCNSQEILTYLGAKQRISGNSFSEWKCLPETGGNNKSKKYKQRKNKYK